MRIITFIILCFIFASCQKEVSTDTNQTVASSFDSLQGRWKYKYDYRLVTTQADTTVVIDSVYGGHYDPFSYFEIKADSSYKWWRSESRTLPMYGWGEGGHVKVIDSLRSIRLFQEIITGDDFGPNTFPSPMPSLGPQYRIKYLGNDSMVLFFRVVGTPGTYWWWHDVYVK